MFDIRNLLIKVNKNLDINCSFHDTFLDNHNHVRSKSKDWKAKEFKVLAKGLNRIAKIG